MALTLSGCAANRPLAQEGGGGPSARRAAQALTAPEGPRAGAGGAAGLGNAATAPGQSGPVLELYSRDLSELRGEVAARCAGASLNREADFLAPLVTDLYLSGVDPADATEALILGNCGPLATLVHELVAQGGNEAAVAVVQRALLLGGPQARPVIESAAESGLEVNVAALAARPSGPTDDGSPSYAMAYFPSRGETRGLETADAVNVLFNAAKPGYGIYTFVLRGAGFDGQSAADRGRYTELLRVIETYVLAEGGIREPSPEVHTFLIPVHPEPTDAALAEQSAPELADPVRRELARYLRQQGRAGMAERLESSPGPFLISSAEPRLVPTRAGSVRLITDLSGVGSEYLYAVVDAYDRPIPAHLAGSPQSLDQIRQQLAGVLAPPGPDGAQVRNARVLWLGPRAGAGSSANVTESAAPLSARGAPGRSWASDGPCAAPGTSGGAEALRA